jgi:hypothetical protein
MFPGLCGLLQARPPRPPGGPHGGHGERGHPWGPQGDKDNKHHSGNKNKRVTESNRESMVDKVTRVFPRKRQENRDHRDN